MENYGVFILGFVVGLGIHVGLLLVAGYFGGREEPATTTPPSFSVTITRLATLSTICDVLAVLERRLYDDLNRMEDEDGPVECAQTHMRLTYVQAMMRIGRDRIAADAAADHDDEEDEVCLDPDCPCVEHGEF